MVQTQVTRIEHIRYIELLRFIIIFLQLIINFLMILNFDLLSRGIISVFLGIIISLPLTTIQIWILRELIQRTPKFPLQPMVDVFYLSDSRQQLSSLYISALIAITTQFVTIMLQYKNWITLSFEPLLIYAGFVIAVIYWGIFINLPRLTNILATLGFIWSMIAILRTFIPSLNVLFNNWIALTLFTLGFPAAIMGLLAHTIPSNQKRYSI